MVGKLMDQFPIIFHLRKPLATQECLSEFLEKIEPKFHSRIVAHNIFGLCNKFDLKGVHLSTVVRNKTPQIPCSGTVSASCNAINEAMILDGKYDYLFLSPIYKTLQRPVSYGELDLGKVKSFLLEKRKSEIIASGGIRANNINELKAYNFDGLAILGAVWTKSPEKNQGSFIKNLNEVYAQL